jgi:hypothetical protein
MRTFLICMLACGAVNASPIVYDETINGELGTPPEQRLLDLGIGANRISGDVTFLGGLGIPVDQWQLDSDLFYFRVPVDSRITSISLSWTIDSLEPATTHFVGGASFSAFVGESEDPALVFQTTEYSMTGLGDALPFSGALSPSPADMFMLTMFSTTGVRAPAGEWAGGVVSYEWIVHVASNSPPSVPEPSGLGVVLLSGLGLFAVSLLKPN